MPLGDNKVQCFKCDKNESLMWHPGEKGIQCNDCYENEQVPNVARTVEKEAQNGKQPQQVEKPKAPVKKNSKTTRSYKTRQNPNALPKQVTPKGKGRRSVFKKSPPIKLIAAPATITTREMVNFKGQLWRKGDIVSVRDVGGGIYYAQIRGFLVDEYCEKSAVLTWLIPTRNESPFPRQGFDPMIYIIGPEDDLPRRMECLEFVMHAPSDYYKDNSPFPTGVPHPRETGYIWGRIN